MCSIDCHKRPLPLKFSQIQHKGKSDVFAAFKTASSEDGNKTKQDGLQQFNPLSKLQVDCYWPFAVRNCYLDVRNCYLEFEGRRARRRAGAQAQAALDTSNQLHVYKYRYKTRFFCVGGEPRRHTRLVGR